jgi:hypothetical protein
LPHASAGGNDNDDDPSSGGDDTSSSSSGGDEYHSTGGGDDDDDDGSDNNGDGSDSKDDDDDDDVTFEAGNDDVEDDDDEEEAEVNGIEEISDKPSRFCTICRRVGRLEHCSVQGCSKGAHMGCIKKLRPVMRKLLQGNDKKMFDSSKLFCGRRCFRTLFVKAKGKKKKQRLEDTNYNPKWSDEALDVLLKWLHEGGNYNRWRGGDKASGQTKKTISTEVSNLIKMKTGEVREPKSVQPSSIVMNRARMAHHDVSYYFFIITKYQSMNGVVSFSAKILMPT